MPDPPAYVVTDVKHEVMADPESATPSWILRSTYTASNGLRTEIWIVETPAVETLTIDADYITDRQTDALAAMVDAITP